MTPSVPCPGPSCAPGVPLSYAPVAPELVQAAAARGAMLVGQMAAKFAEAVQGPLQAGVATTQDLLGKFDAVLNVGAVSGQALIDQLGANFGLSVRAQAQPPPGGGAGGQVSDGVTEGQYAYNLYQYILSPYGIYILPQGQKPAVEPDHPVCFVASFQNVYDAVAFVNSHSGTLLRPDCVPVGGPTGTTTSACPSDLWQAYQLFTVLGDGSQQLVGCTIRCTTDPQPPNSILLGNPGPYDVAKGLLDTVACKITPPTTGGPGPKYYYGGCDKDHKPVAWESTEKSPPGTIGAMGPYQNQAEALNAGAFLCQSLGIETSGGTCPPTQVTCPAPVVNVSCPGAPGSTGGTTGTTPPVSLPDCIMIDLCDWDRFKQTLVDALCDWYKTCVCKLDNEAAYMTADCDDQFAAQMNGWFGKLGGTVVGQPSMDNLVSSGKGEFKASGKLAVPILPR